MRQFVERTDVHGDQRRVTAVGIEDARANPNPAGRDRTSGGGRQDAAVKWVLRKGNAVEAGRFRGLRLGDTLPWRHAAMQPDAQLWQTLQGFVLPGTEALRSHPAAARHPLARNGHARRAIAPPPYGTR